MTEYFVSFDLAKKLKEKGFREKCLAFYTSTKSFYYNNTNVCSDVEDLLECCNESEEYDDIDAPTISQVLKWLREEKKRLVVIHPEGHDVHYYYTIHNLARSFDTFEYTQSFATYESAAIAGIECCLDNLI